MSGLARRSGSLATRCLNSLKSPAVRLTRISPAYRASPAGLQRRHYAKGKPKVPKDENKANDEQKPVSNEPSKPAPGFENLYDKSSMSPPTEGQKQDDGVSKISEEDEKALKAIVEQSKMILPSAVAQDLGRLIDRTKRHGITPELRELIDTYKSGKPLTISNAVKIIRLFNTMANQSEEPEDKAKAGGKTDSKKEGDKNFNWKSNENKQGAGGPSAFKLDMNTIVVSLFSSYLFYKIASPSEAKKDITWQEFNASFLQKGLVEKLAVVNGSKVKVYLHREAVKQQHPDSPAGNDNFHYYFSIGSVEGFERRLEQVQDDLDIPTYERIPVSYQETSSIATEIMLSLLPTLLLMGGIIYLSRRGSGGGGGGSSGIFGMGKSRAKKFNHDENVKVKFADVAGMDEAKVEIMEFVSFLQTPERFMKLGAKIPRGAILSGPPGTGKTLLAKATAGESGVPFFSVSGAEFVEIFVGVGPSRVRDLFANARKSTPCIIFIDEIDAIGRSRAGKGGFNGGNDEREATLNQILTEMDGFNTTDQVVVLAGTNRPDVLDAALMRPGRFDRHIAIDRPTMDGRKQIFLVHLKNIVTDENMEHLTGRLSALTPGFSGADIANCCNEAALIGECRT